MDAFAPLQNISNLDLMFYSDTFFSESILATVGLSKALQTLFIIPYGFGIRHALFHPKDATPMSKATNFTVHSIILTFVFYILPATMPSLIGLLFVFYSILVYKTVKNQLNFPFFRLQQPKGLRAVHIPEIIPNLADFFDYFHFSKGRHDHKKVATKDRFWGWCNEERIPARPRIAPPAPTTELEYRQKCYQFTYSKNIKSPFLSNLPKTQKPSLSWRVMFMGKAAVLEVEGYQASSAEFFSRLQRFSLSKGLLRVLGLRKRYERKLVLADYVNALYDDPGEVPSVDLLNSDAAFCRWRLSGPNPCVLAKCTDLNKMTFNEENQFTRRIRVALREGRLFIIDYSVMSEFTPNDAKKFTMGAIALFELPLELETRQKQSIVPLCIQLNAKKCEKQSFFPDGDLKWKIAKAVFSSLDGNYHEAIVHLAHTHLVMESFLVGTYRQLPSSHPLFCLLAPHFEGTAHINNFADEELISPGGLVEQLVSQKVEEINDLVGEEVKHMMSDDFSFPALLERRQMDKENFRAPFPYRDDGQLIWDAVEEWITNYVDIIYKDDEDVKNDERLDSWIIEMSNGGMCTWLKRFDYTKTMLVRVLSAVVFTASAQHAAVNFPQKELMQFTPAWPLGMYNTLPVAECPQEADYISYLPPIAMAMKQAALGTLLGGIYYTKLGHYKNLMPDNLEVQIALRKFQSRLNQATLKIEQRNSNRVAVWGDSLEAKDFAYTALLPVNIPQSVNI